MRSVHSKIIQNLETRNQIPYIIIIFVQVIGKL